MTTTGAASNDAAPARLSLDMCLLSAGSPQAAAAGDGRQAGPPPSPFRFSSMSAGGSRLDVCRPRPEHRETMLGARRAGWLCGGTLAVLAPVLAGAVALQLLAGGIRGQSLSPVVLAFVLGLLGG